VKQEGVQQADGIARLAEQAFREYPHWQTSSHSAGVGGVVDVAQRILTMLRRASHEV
jgi:hypothetical protein